MKNKLHIPDIGDLLTLAEPWDFVLYIESRNSELFEYFGYQMRTFGGLDFPIPKDIYEEAEKQLHQVEAEIQSTEFYQRLREIQSSNYWNDDKLRKERDKLSNEYYSKRDIAISIIREFILSKVDENKRNKYIHVTFPAGTTLRVARVYIRQGAKDYSSVTFWADFPEKKKKKKKYKFWASLSDVNKIFFERETL